MPGKKTELASESGLITDAILQGMLEKKAMDPVILDFTEMNNAVSNAFVICHGTSRVQVEAIAESVVETVKKKMKVMPWHKEGFENAEWILIDYADVVVHIFQEHRRTFYNLENLWGDAKVSRIETL